MCAAQGTKRSSPASNLMIRTDVQGMLHDWRTRLDHQ
jgi:hypothetical protein